MNGVSIGIRLPGRQARAAKTENRWWSPVCRPGDWICQAYSRHRQRRALAQLDDRLLQDIGVTRQQALRESRKPFWRA